MDDITLYRMLRYFAVIIYEHYNLKNEFNQKFNMPIPEKPITLEDVLRNICKDFGLKYEVVLENSKLEKWYGNP